MSVAFRRSTACRAFSSSAAALGAKPAVKPASPNFGSGPCKKRPGWSVAALQDGALGRSHRSALGKAKLAECIGTCDGTHTKNPHTAALCLRPCVLYLCHLLSPPPDGPDEAERAGTHTQPHSV